MTGLLKVSKLNTKRRIRLAKVRHLRKERVPFLEKILRLIAPRTAPHVIAQGSITAETIMLAAYADTIKNGASTEADTSTANERLSVRIVRLLQFRA